MQVESRRLPLSHSFSSHSTHTLLLAVAGAQLCFLPWALGSVHAWAHLTSLGLSVACLTIALFRPHPGLRPASTTIAIVVCAVFGIIWIGLQAFNVAWRYETDGHTWWMTPVPHVAWLPAGLSIPFALGGPFRSLVLLSSLLAFLASLHLGIQRRSGYQALLLILSANGTVLSLLGLLQKASGTKRILWLYTPSNGDFLSTFIYRNHGGAYLNLTLALTLGLFLWSARRNKPFAGPRAPTPLFALAALIQMTAITISGSRLSAAISILLLVVAVIFHFATRRTPAPRWQAGPLVLAAVFIGFGLFCIQSIGSEKLWLRFAAAGKNPSSALDMRLLIGRAATPMLTDHLLRGWGAGCFRFGFPLYSQNYPDLCREGDRPRFVEHAHNDFLEYAIELGLVGLLPAAVWLAIVAARLVALRFWRHPSVFLLTTGAVFTLAHGAFDFVLQNPAVLFTWAVVLLVAVKLADRESPTRARSPTCFPRSNIGQTEGPLRRVDR